MMGRFPCIYKRMVAAGASLLATLGIIAASMTPATAVSLTPQPVGNPLTPLSDPRLVSVDLRGGGTAYVDERYGSIDVRSPSVTVPGVGGPDLEIGLTYRGALATNDTKRAYGDGDLGDWQ